MTEPRRPEPDPFASPEPGGYPPPPGSYSTGDPAAYHGGQPGYGAAGDAGPGYAVPYGGAPTDYASWPLRVAAYLIDLLIADSIYIVARITRSGVLLAIGVLFAIGFWLWNWARQGRTGQTVGKGVVGTRLVRAGNGTYVGAGVSIGRGFLHIIDALPCYIGFLWPLWDAKKQTFADKILNTVVVKS